MPSPVERIDFARVATQIAAKVKTPPATTVSRPKGAALCEEKNRVALHEASRRTGLVYIIKHPDPGSGTPDERITRSKGHRDRALDNLKNHPLGRALAKGDNKWLFEIRPHAAALAEKPELYHEVARYSVLQIRGFSFEDLRSTLPAGHCIYDFGYQLEETLNELVTDAQDLWSSVLPDEPFFSISCHDPPQGPLDNDPYDWPIAAMNLPAAWKIHETDPAGYGANIRVGHLDTGYSDHPALKGDRLLADKGVDLVDDDRKAVDPLVTTTFNSEPGHGTSTATLIMSASEDNPPAQVVTTGVIGAAPRAEIVPIRVCDSTAFIFNSKVADGLAAAIKSDCKVVSMSVGGFDVPGFEHLAEIARRKNILLIAAAGNCTYGVAAPASYSQVLAVGASCKDSTYWRHAPDDAKVDIAAPGDNVRTTKIGAPSWLCRWVARLTSWFWPASTTAHPKYAYDFGSGTSFSTAYAAGVAALWRASLCQAGMQVPPGLFLGDIFKKALQDSANKPDGWDKALHGAGIINAQALLKFDTAALIKQSVSLPPDDPFDPAEALLKRLSRTIYGVPGKEDELVATARNWFGVDDAGARANLKKFGTEMVNLLLKTKTDATNARVKFNPRGKDEDCFLQFFQTHGSATLRHALMPK